MRPRLGAWIVIDGQPAVLPLKTKYARRALLIKGKLCGVTFERHRCLSELPLRQRRAQKLPSIDRRQRRYKLREPIRRRFCNQPRQVNEPGASRPSGHP